MEDVWWLRTDVVLLSQNLNNIIMEGFCYTTTHDIFAGMINYQYSYKSTTLFDRVSLYNAAISAGYRIVEIVDAGIIYQDIN